jgi:hypothetical protein
VKRFLFFLICTTALLCLLATPAFANPRTFWVSPNIDPITKQHLDDTHNIQAAFDAAVKAGPGSTVQLSAGRFYANTIVVAGFRGTFKGAGQGRTFIDTLRGLNEKLTGLGLPVDPADATQFLSPTPVFFTFDGGDFRASDLTFDITAPDPAVESTYYGAPQNRVDTVVLVTGSASSAFDHVGIVAHPSLPGFTSDGLPYNANQGIFVTGRMTLDSDGNPALPTTPVGGVDTVSSCTFQNIPHGVLEAVFDGTLTVGGSPGTGNRFVNEGQNAFTIAGAGGASTVFSYNVVDDTAVPDDSTEQCGVASFQPDNSTGLTPWPRRVVISHNTMRGCWEGVLALQTDDGSGGPLWPIHYLISDNCITTTHSQDEGIVLEDLSLYAGQGKSLDAMIIGNHIVLNDTIGGGIDGWFVNDAQVLGNCISGSGVAGIYVGYGGDTDSGWRIVGNDVSGVNTAAADADPSWGVQTAPIWLGPGTSDCLVIGGPWPTTVLNQGSGNILINVTLLPLPAGPASALLRASNTVPKAGLLRLRR